MQTLNFEQAVEALQNDQLVIFPTETVYGLGANAASDEAVARIYEAKGRPSFNPLIVHVSGQDQASTLGIWGHRAGALANAFWPGPLTIVLPQKSESKVSTIVTAGSENIALRCAAREQVRKLADKLPSGVAAPSANKSGLLSPSRAAHVMDSFNDVSWIGYLSGEEPNIGLESTVIDISGPNAQILRHGAVTKAQLERVIGQVTENQKYLEDFSDEQVSSPGQLRRHYAPPIPLFLNQLHVFPGQALLAFGSDVPNASLVYNLSYQGDLVEAASRLFEGLHVLSGSGADAICAMPVPNEGIGRAINDRLARGAVPL